MEPLPDDTKRGPVYPLPIVSRTERLFDLIQLLRSHPYPVTAAKLAAELGVTVRTVYRDIGTLRAIGAPVEGEAGLGYLLRPGFLLPPLMFTEQEVEALALGARWVAKRGDSQLRRAARGALARIAAVLPARLRDELEEAPLIVGPAKGGGPGTSGPHSGPRAHDADHDSLLITLRRAIRAQRKVRLRYRSRAGEQSERVVWPIALSYFDSVRVVVAWCELRTDFRAFRSDLIETAQPLSERFLRPRTALLHEWQQREGIARGELTGDA